MKKGLESYVWLLIWIAALLLIGSGVGALTQTSVDTWYLTLDRSPLTPPNYVFGIAWSILYIMIAISGWLIWRAHPFTGLRQIKTLFIAQLLLNWSWSPLFFGFHFIGWSLICLVLLVILVGWLVIKTYTPLKTASLLLMPYLGWLIFATYLNGHIWYAHMMY